MRRTKSHQRVIFLSLLLLLLLFTTSIAKAETKKNNEMIADIIEEKEENMIRELQDFGLINTDTLSFSPSQSISSAVPSISPSSLSSSITSSITSPPTNTEPPSTTNDSNKNDESFSLSNNLLNTEIYNYEANSVLTTDLRANTGSYGNMFDIQAQKKLVVTDLFFLTDVATDVTYEIYTVEGSYFPHRNQLDAWTLIGTGTTRGLGIKKPTPVGNFTPISLEPDDVQGFYLTLTTYDIRYLKGQGESVNDTLQENDDIIVKVGSGVGDYPLGTTIFEPRLWRGSIQYFVWGEPSAMPSSAPSLMPSVSVAPSSAPSLVPTLSLMPTIGIREETTDQLITVFGYDLDLMDENSILSFESTIQEFLDTALTEQNPTLNITEVRVNEQTLNQLNIDRTRRRLATSSLNVLTSITGQYLPPPELVFDTVVEDSIETQSETVVKRLKEVDPPSFQNVESVTSVTVPKTAPAPSTSSDTTFLNTPVGYGVIGGICFVVLLMGFGIARLVYTWTQKEDAEESDEHDVRRGSYDDIADILAEKYAKQQYSQRFWSQRNLYD